MSSQHNNSNYKQVTNVNRRSWDKESYAKRAKDRQEKLTQHHDSGKNSKKSSYQQQQQSGDRSNDRCTGGLILDNENENEEFIPAIAGAAGPEGSQRAFLKARKHRVHHIDDKIGSTDIISIEAATKLKSATDDDIDVDNDKKKKKKDKKKISDITLAVQKVGIGWHCTVCDCFLKDSHTYLDHINGRKHQRALGFSMRVERSSKEQVLEKLQQLTNHKQQQSTNNEKTYNWNQLVDQKDEEDRIRKEERLRKRKERRNKMKDSVDDESPSGNSISNEEETYVSHTATTTNPLNNHNSMGQTTHVKTDNIITAATKIEIGDDEASIVEEEINPDLAAMMGFSGFGATSR